MTALKLSEALSLRLVSLYFASVVEELLGTVKSFSEYFFFLIMTDNTGNALTRVTVTRKGFLIKDILEMDRPRGRKADVVSSKKASNNSKLRQRRPRLGGLSSGQRRRRTAFSRPQLAFLERKFQCQKYLTLSDRGQVADQLSLSEAQIKCWFQNRRTKWKRQTSLAVRADQLREHAVHHQNGCPHQAFEPHDTTPAEQAGTRGDRQRPSRNGRPDVSVSASTDPWLGSSFAAFRSSPKDSTCHDMLPASPALPLPLAMERTSKGFTVLPPFLTSPLSFFHHSGFSFSSASARY